MKTYIFAILIIVLSTVSVLSQETNIGVKGGISIPNLSSKEDNVLSKNYKSRTAMNFGAFAETAVNEKVSIQIEGNFAGQGGIRDGVQPIAQPLPGLPALPAGCRIFTANSKIRPSSTISKCP